jgi:hypothetical protein
MKIMKYTTSKTVLFVTLLFICQQGIAQANKKHSFSINFGPEAAFPESAFRTTHRTGYGGSFTSEYTFGKHGSATFNTGFSVFSGRTDFATTASTPADYKSLVAIPLKAGARYYFGRFYFFGETGLVFLNKYANSTNAIVSAGAGDKIKLGDNFLDISLRQETWLNSSRNFNMAVLRVAYEIVW